MDILKCYETLCISSNSTVNEVKVAYKKLCLKYHPDKCNGSSNEKFIEITDAYKRVLQHNSNVENVNFYIYLMFHIFNTMKEHNDVIINLSIDIEDIYMAKVKKIHYTRFGSKGLKEKKCFFLELHGIQEQYVLANEGDFNIFKKTYSDLIINVSIDIQNKDLHIDNCINPLEIYIRKSICIYEFYYGVFKNIEYLNNTELDTMGYIPFLSGSTQVLEKRGLPDENKVRANVYIIFEIDTSICKIDESTRNVVKELFA